MEIDVNGITTQITNPLETVTNKEITQNLLNQNTNSVTLSNLMTNPSTNYGLTKESTLIPKLTTLTNQRVTSSTLTVSDLIPLTDQSTSLGLSRTSTLVLDPPVNYGDITITQPGQYLPSDFNSQGLYDPTHSAGYEYINQINVTQPQPSKIKIKKITSNDNNYIWLDENDRSNWHYISSETTINNTAGRDILFLYIVNNTYDVGYFWNYKSSTLTIGNKTWYKVANFPSGYDYPVRLLDNNDNQIIEFVDRISGDNYSGFIQLSINLFEFDISWLTFN